MSTQNVEVLPRKAGMPAVDRDIVWNCVRETTIITCRYFPERAGDALVEMIEAHKRLYPERHEQGEEQKSMVIQCFMCKTIQIRAEFCVECGLMLSRANLVEGKRIIYRKIV